MTQLRVAVIDDHPLMLEGIRHILSQQRDVEIVGVGACADDAVRIVRDKSPDIVLLDVRMPGCGLEAARRIKASRSATMIIFLTVSESTEDVTSALAAGASGYVLKGIGGNDLVRTLHSVARGETYVTPEFAARLLLAQTRAPGDKVKSDISGDKNRLTAREQQILGEISLGKTNKEIANKFGIAEKTVKHYVGLILQKLGARNRVEAVIASGKAFSTASRA